jgi:hypothetical protein
MLGHMQTRKPSESNPWGGHQTNVAALEQTRLYFDNILSMAMLNGTVADQTKARKDRDDAVDRLYHAIGAPNPSAIADATPASSTALRPVKATATPSQAKSKSIREQLQNALKKAQTRAQRLRQNAKGREWKLSVVIALVFSAIGGGVGWAVSGTVGAVVGAIIPIALLALMWVVSTIKKKAKEKKKQNPRTTGGATQGATINPINPDPTNATQEGPPPTASDTRGN